MDCRLSSHARSSHLIHLGLLLAVLLGPAQPVQAGMQPGKYATPLVRPAAPDAATQVDLSGPAGSGQFGYSVTVLPNGNFVVADPNYDAPGPIADAGAVYLYDGYTLAVLNTLTGSQANDVVGSEGITVLSNGSYVVNSPYWDASGPVADVGAVTWCSGSSGCNGAVSASNSLVGSQASDQVGIGGITALSNGSYVVRSQNWDASGPVSNVGAVTWCSGSGGCTGAVSASNSLVGSQASDQVGIGGITVLSNGNYVVGSYFWDAGPVINVGAVTWCSGSSGCTGAVSAINSLVGTQANDSVGNPAPATTALSNGNYVVRSPYWDASGPYVSNVGAVTWCSGSGGCTGAISASISLVGSQANDYVGNGGVTVLNNGSYVVPSYNWDGPGAISDVGAVTWCSGSGGCTGAVSSLNSLVGSRASDQVGYWGTTRITALSNGSYVVGSNNWDAGAVSNAGAATWCSGSGGCTGTVSALNSLVGSQASDRVGLATALSNGNYVVNSPNWDGPGPVSNVGAVTWCSGSVGCTPDVVSTSNSLVGGQANDQVGQSGVIALSDGSYVVGSYFWDAPGPVSNVGAVTWCNSSGGCNGAVVSTSNSLVGGQAEVQVGYAGVNALRDGNYVVRSYTWDAPGPVSNVGAVTWCGSGGSCNGAVVSTSNSLVGSQVNDQVGQTGFTVLSNGSYVVGSPSWDAPGAVTDAGAVTWCSASGGCNGAVVSDLNSLVGGQASDRVGMVTALSNGNYVVSTSTWDAPGPLTDAGAITLGAGYAAFPVRKVSAGASVTGGIAGGALAWAFDPLNDQLLVGRKSENLVSVFKQPHTSIQSGSWSAAANWDYGAPVDRSDVDIAGGYTISLGADAAAENLTLTSGRVALGDYSLAVDQSLSVSGAPGIDRMIVSGGDGALRKRFSGTGSFTFPLGTDSGTAEYSPFTINFSAGAFAPGAWVAARALDSKLPEITSANYIDRHWIVTQSGISGFTYDATLQYLPADVQGVEANTLGLKNDAGAWTLGSAADTVNHRYTFTGLSSFSGFGGGSDPTAVTLADFRAISTAGQVSLAWQTTLEIDLVGFNLYRCPQSTFYPDASCTRLNPDLIPGDAPGQLEGASYTFVDHTLPAGQIVDYWLEVIHSHGQQLFGPRQAARDYGLYLPLILHER